MKVDALAELVHPLGDLLTFTVLVSAAFVWRLRLRKIVLCTAAWPSSITHLPVHTSSVHSTYVVKHIQREHIEELTFVGPDAAIVRFCSVLTGGEQSPNEPIRSRKFLVATRRQGVWKVLGAEHEAPRRRSRVECFATLRKPGG